MNYVIFFFFESLLTQKIWQNFSQLLILQIDNGK